MTRSDAARDEILRRVREAVAGTEPVEVPREYRQGEPEGLGPAALLELLDERLVDYGATVHRCVEGDLTAVLVVALGSARSVVLPPGLPDALGASLGEIGLQVWVDLEPAELEPRRLDSCDAVVTTCTVAIAETGTLVLDGSAGQGRRAVSLVPDHHVCIVRSDQVVAGVPAALSRLDPRRPLTFISGPSATSDIELQRVEGVHGPRLLEVVIVGPEEPRT